MLGTYRVIPWYDESVRDGMINNQKKNTKIVYRIEMVTAIEALRWFNCFSGTGTAHIILL